MSLRRFANRCAAASAFALTLTLAAPAGAQDIPGAAPDLHAAPDMRPEWRGPMAGPAPVAVLQPDARTRDAWLSECRRRTAMYYGGYRSMKHRDRKGAADRGYRGGYDYCEAYFDDYYRTYRAHAYAYAIPMVMMPMHQQMTASRTISRPVEEVVTEEYVPVETRVYERRPARRIIRDKRVPDKRIRIGS